MLQHILPPDIDDESHLRLQPDDICEILFRAYAEIHSLGVNVFSEHRNHALVPGFVRKEIVRSEVSARFGELRNHSPKFLVGQADGKAVCDNWWPADI